MSGDTIMSRGIRSVRDVIIEEKSPGYRAGLVIEPNNWVDVDPFILINGRRLFCTRHVWNAPAPWH